MQTNINTASAVASQLKSLATRFAHLPNTFAMVDARAQAFGGVSNAIELCAIHLRTFIATNDKAAARAYLAMVRRVSDAIAMLSEYSENPAVGATMLDAQKALLAAHIEFQAHIEAMLTANSATVQA